MASNLSIQDLRPVIVRDSRVDFEHRPTYPIYESGSTVLQTAVTTSSVSNSSIVFNYVPPGVNIYIDRNIKIYIPMRLTFTGAPGAGNKLLNPSCDAPRAFPIANMMDTLNCYINGTSVSIRPATVVQPMLHYQSEDLDKRDYSTTPTYFDQFQSYNVGAGTNLNPLARHSDCIDGSVFQRGSSNYVIVANPTAVGTEIVTAIVDLAVSEKLFLPPFYSGPNDKSFYAFYNLTSMNFTMTFVNQIANRVWSHATQNSSGVTVSVPFVTSTAALGGTAGGPQSFTNDQVLLLVNQITPREVADPGPMRPLTFPYFKIQDYPGNPITIAAGSTSTLTTTNLSFPSIPNRIYIWARERASSLQSSATKTDTFLACQNLEVIYGNRPLLQSMTQTQIYDMCVKNGLRDSFMQWIGEVPDGSMKPGSTIGTMGSVICIDTVEDFGFASDLSPGVQVGTMNFTVRGIFKNTSGLSIDAELIVVTVDEGIFAIPNAGSSSLHINVLTREEVLNASTNGEIPSVGKDTTTAPLAFGGGSFWSKLGNAAKNVFGFVKDNHLLSKGLSHLNNPYAQTGSQVASALGLGGVSAGVSAGRRIRGGVGVSRDRLVSQLMS